MTINADNYFISLRAKRQIKARQFPNFQLRTFLKSVSQTNQSYLKYQIQIQNNLETLFGKKPM